MLYLTVASGINAFTPSALSTVLLSDANNDHDSIYAALRRHVSTTYADRHYSESYCEGNESSPNEKLVCEVFSMSLITTPGCVSLTRSS